MWTNYEGASQDDLLVAKSLALHRFLLVEEILTQHVD
jgi:hypothetical protein